MTTKIFFLILFIPFTSLRSIFKHFNFRRINSIRFFLVSTFTAILLHLTGFFISDYYQPFHLINRGLNAIGLNLMLCSGIFLFFFTLMAEKIVKDNLISRLTFFSVLVGMMMVAIAFGEFRSVNYHFSNWEGLSYLYVASPIVVFAVMSRHLAGTLSQIKHTRGI